jgi:D-3-phosphoglycerate dehydrogenase
MEVQMAKILITPRSFAKHNQAPYQRLAEAGIEVIHNPVGDILSKEEMMYHVKDIDGIIVGVDPMDQDVLSCAKNLSVISKYGVGTDNIDLDYCKQKTIDVTITKNANSEAVSDYAFTLILSVARRVVEIDQGCRNNDWSKKVAVDVFGKKIGILGLGAIGKGVAKRAKSFDMEIYGYDICYDDAFMAEYGIKQSCVEEIIRTCDFISLHLPLVEETKYLINKDSLKMAKDNLIIINTSRGGVINEDDLYDALKHKQIYGAGIDVFETEPAQNSKLLELENVIVGSHCAASTAGAVNTMSNMAVDNIIKILKERGKI